MVRYGLVRSVLVVLSKMRIAPVFSRMKRRLLSPGAAVTKSGCERPLGMIVRRLGVWARDGAMMASREITGAKFLSCGRSTRIAQPPECLIITMAQGALRA